MYDFHLSYFQLYDTKVNYDLDYPAISYCGQAVELTTFCKNWSFLLKVRIALTRQICRHERLIEVHACVHLTLHWKDISSRDWFLDKNNLMRFLDSCHANFWCYSTCIYCCEYLIMAAPNKEEHNEVLVKHCNEPKRTMLNSKSWLRHMQDILFPRMEWKLIQKS